MPSAYAAATRPSSARSWIALPLVGQEADHTCGAAALRAIALHHGIAITERALVDAMLRFDDRGSDPVHVRAGAAQLGLVVDEHRGMTDAQLRTCLDAGHPVMVTLQVDDGGHWMVASGHDDATVYFMDPMRDDALATLTWAELAARWHDVEGDDDRPLVRYGIAIWR